MESKGVTIFLIIYKSIYIILKTKRFHVHITWFEPIKRDPSLPHLSLSRIPSFFLLAILLLPAISIFWITPTSNRDHGVQAQQRTFHPLISQFQLRQLLPLHSRSLHLLRCFLSLWTSLILLHWKPSKPNHQPVNSTPPLYSSSDHLLYRHGTAIPQSSRTLQLSTWRNICRSNQSLDEIHGGDGSDESPCGGDNRSLCCVARCGQRLVGRMVAIQRFDPDIDLTFDFEVRNTYLVCLIHVYFLWMKTEGFRFSNSVRLTG